MHFACHILWLGTSLFKSVTLPALGEHVTQGSRSSPSAAVQTERSVHAANVNGCSSSIPPYLHTACCKDAGLQEVKKICLLLFLLQNCPFCFSALWDFASPTPQGFSWLFLWPVCDLQMVAKTWNCMHWLCVSSPFGPSFPIFGAILQKLYFGVSANWRWSHLRCDFQSSCSLDNSGFQKKEQRDMFFLTRNATLLFCVLRNKSLSLCLTSLQVSDHMTRGRASENSVA